MKSNRRTFIKIIGLFFCTNTIYSWLKGIFFNEKRGLYNLSSSAYASQEKFKRLGMDGDGFSTVYMVKDAPHKTGIEKIINSFGSKTTSERNVIKVMEMMGGIKEYIGKKDIVIIKPNAQRYNQGMTNTDAIKGFIDLVLEISGFRGEIIIAENHQTQKDNNRGWTTEHRNGKFNLNELVQFYHKKGYKNVTKYHWHNAGSCEYPLEGDAHGNSRVNGPEDGDGYVWMEECYYTSPNGRKCLMSYPVFTSPYSGIRIDLKNGAWKDGKYINRPVKFINFSALNHHGRYAGVSASVKNLMGVVDMTCGFPGDLPADAYNVHHIGVSKMKHLFYHTLGLRGYRGALRYKFLDYCYRNFSYAGGALGCLMQYVKFPDLNIIAADLVGWGDRKKLDRAFRPKAILASTDPVALDYIAAKEILLPGTPSDEKEESGKKYKDLNNPDNPQGMFKKFLRETHKQGIGNINPERIRVTASGFEKR